jgi:hypothetical protein
MRLDMPESARLFSANQLDNPICQHLSTNFGYAQYAAILPPSPQISKNHKILLINHHHHGISDDDDRRELVIEAAVRYIVIKRISDEAEAKKKSAASEKQGDSAAS